MSAALVTFSQGVSIAPSIPSSFGDTLIAINGATATVTSSLTIGSEEIALSNGPTLAPGEIAILADGSISLVPPVSKTTAITNPMVTGALAFTSGSTANFTNATVTGLPQSLGTEFTVIFDATNGGLSTHSANGAPIDFGGTGNSHIGVLNNQGGAFLCLVNGTQTGSILNTFQTSSVCAITRQSGVAGVCNTISTVKGKFDEHFVLDWSNTGQLSLTMHKLGGGHVWVVGTVYTAYVTFILNSNIKIT